MIFWFFFFLKTLCHCDVEIDTKGKSTTERHGALEFLMVLTRHHCYHFSPHLGTSAQDDKFVAAELCKSVSSCEASSVLRKC